MADNPDFACMLQMNGLARTGQISASSLNSRRLTDGYAADICGFIVAAGICDYALIDDLKPLTNNWP
jgi:hypothetical protein